MPRVSKKVRDTKTGKEYQSMYKAGLALHKLVDGSKEDHFVWYKIVKAYPERFEVKEQGSSKWRKASYAGKPAKKEEIVETKEEKKLNARARLASLAEGDKERRKKAAVMEEVEEEEEEAEESEEEEEEDPEEEDEEESEEDDEEEDEELISQLKESVKAAKKNSSKSSSKKLAKTPLRKAS